MCVLDRMLRVIGYFELSPEPKTPLPRIKKSLAIWISAGAHAWLARLRHYPVRYQSVRFHLYV